MKLDLMKTLKRIEKNISFKDKTDVEKLKVAYEDTLRLRSQLLSVIHNEEVFCLLGKCIYDGLFAGLKERSGYINNYFIVILCHF